MNTIASPEQKAGRKEWIGLAVLALPGIDMVVASAPPQSAGAAAGISETSTTLGSALGIALLGSIWTAGYRARMDFGVPAGISSRMTEAARNTLGAAMSAGIQLGEPWVPYSSARQEQPSSSP